MQKGMGALGVLQVFAAIGVCRWVRAYRPVESANWRSSGIRLISNHRGIWLFRCYCSHGCTSKKPSGGKQCLEVYAGIDRVQKLRMADESTQWFVAAATKDILTLERLREKLLGTMNADGETALMVVCRNHGDVPCATMLRGEKSSKEGMPTALVVSVVHRTVSIPLLSVLQDQSNTPTPSGLYPLNFAVMYCVDGAIVDALIHTDYRLCSEKHASSLETVTLKYTPQLLVTLSLKYPMVFSRNKLELSLLARWFSHAGSDNVEALRPLIALFERTVNTNGRSALMHAAASNSFNAVKLLCKRESGLQDSAGSTGLIEGLHHNVSLPVVRELLCESDIPDNSGRFPIAIAASSRCDPDIVRCIIQHDMTGNSYHGVMQPLIQKKYTEPTIICLVQYYPTVVLPYVKQLSDYLPSQPWLKRLQHFVGERLFRCHLWFSGVVKRWSCRTKKPIDPAPVSDDVRWFEAAQTLNYGTLESLATRHPSGRVFKTGETALMLACRNIRSGGYQLRPLLIEAGIASSTSTTALMNLLQNENFVHSLSLPWSQALAFLVRREANICNSDGVYPIQMAIREALPAEAIEKLLKADYECSAPDICLCRLKYTASVMSFAEQHCPPLYSKIVDLL